MLGVDRFSSVFGGSPAHTESHYVEHLRAVIRAGYSPVLCKPGTAEPACILTPHQRKVVAKLGDNHPCGSDHVLNDPAKVGAVVKNWLKIYGGLNVALHLGRSRLAVIQAPAGPGMTVEVGNYVMGHWWFDIPEGRQASSGSAPVNGWSFRAGDEHVLVPPSKLHRSEFRLVGGTIEAAPWMLR